MQPTLDDISIHASREGSDGDAWALIDTGDISIHASREGSDVGNTQYINPRTGISIHASREGSDTGQ